MSEDISIRVVWLRHFVMLCKIALYRNNLTYLLATWDMLQSSTMSLKMQSTDAEQHEVVSDDTATQVNVAIFTNLYFLSICRISTACKWLLYAYFSSIILNEGHLPFGCYFLVQNILIMFYVKFRFYVYSNMVTITRLLTFACWAVHWKVRCVVYDAVQHQQQLSKSADNISDIIEVESVAGMTEEEKLRVRYVHKRRFVSCISLNKCKL